jgi:hypothetical protein
MRTLRDLWPLAALFVALALAPACTRATDVNDVAVGSDVAVTTKDGSTIRGTVVDVSDEALVIEGKHTGQRDRIERTAIEEVEETGPSALSDLLADTPASHDVTVPAGTIVPVTLDVALASDGNHAEDPVSATVRTTITVDGFETIPEGSTLRGSVTQATPAGKVKGRAALAFSFDQLTIDHERYDIAADPIVYHARASTKKDAATIGGGAAVGTVVGAIAGGKKGAAIGAAAGGGAGTAVVLGTSGDEVRLSPGLELAVELTAPVVITVPQDRPAAAPRGSEH